MSNVIHITTGAFEKVSKRWVGVQQAPALVQALEAAGAR